MLLISEEYHNDIVGKKSTKGLAFMYVGVTIALKLSGFPTRGLILTKHYEEEKTIFLKY